MSISVKISEENYEKLCELSGKLTAKLHRPVSINDAISFLYRKKKLSDLAGAWVIRDEEVDSFKKNLKKGWKQWGKRSV